MSFEPWTLHAYTHSALRLAQCVSQMDDVCATFKRKTEAMQELEDMSQMPQTTFVQDSAGAPAQLGGTRAICTQDEIDLFMNLLASTVQACNEPEDEETLRQYAAMCYRVRKVLEEQFIHIECDNTVALMECQTACDKDLTLLEHQLRVIAPLCPSQQSIVRILHKTIAQFKSRI